MTSTGNKSIKFIKNTQQNSVNASGATKSFWPRNEPRTFSSTNSTIHSTKFCAPSGTPAVARRATRWNNHKNTAPNANDQPRLSRCSAIKPISAACAPVSATPQLPSG